MKRLTRLSLTQKLLGAIGLPLLLAFIALGLIVNTQLNNAIPPMLEDTSARQVDARANEIGRWIEGYRTLLSGLAKDERLAESVPVEEHLDWLASRHPGDATIESFYFADASGDTVTHTGARADISSRGYFQELIVDGTTDRLLADPVLSLVSGLPTAIIAEAIFDEAGNRVGLLGITLSMEAVSEITSAIDVGEGSYGYMVDSGGMVVAHPDPDLRMNLNVTEADQAGFQGANALGQRILSGEPGIGQVVSPFGGNVTMVWSPIRGTGGWALAAAIPSNVFTAVSTNLLFSLLIVGAVILLLLLVIVGFTARKALAPIKQTAQAMADIAQGKGDLTRRLTAHSMMKWASSPYSSTASSSACSGPCRKCAGTPVPSFPAPATWPTAPRSSPRARSRPPPTCRKPRHPWRRFTPPSRTPPRHPSRPTDWPPMPPGLPSAAMRP
ncbi:cache domain-containing protein [Halomonas sp. BC04]|uniref:cache domain-containing protein n=1 Tax=Halomonas sp. BC04 TaxID=1403540 RepID=UPI0003ED66AF|nr:cache domain-containing protein [Halomonas sp. BC04]EWH02461.1 hypothetical protein Q427_08650 [Halomonas sp. BC04]